MRLISLLIPALGLSIFVGCASSEKLGEQPLTSKEAVLDPEATLVDVRIPAEYAEKTAAGAINIPLAILGDSLDYFKRQQKVVVFCNKGRQANEAYHFLKNKGVNVYFGKTHENVEAIQNQKK